jgi:hypothetical protein
VTIHDGAERLDIALDFVQATGCSGVVGEPRVALLSLLVKVTEGAGDAGLGLVEAPVLRRDEVLWVQGFLGVTGGWLRCLAVTTKSAPDLRLYRSGALEAARRIELLYRALQEDPDGGPHRR